MNVVLVHNFYQLAGGEDQVFTSEGALLESYGHEVTRYTVHNDAVQGLGRLQLAKATIWNSEQYSKLRALFRELRPQIVHVHNTLPLISPAVYYAAKDEGAAVVQTLHNYRMSCVNGLFFRQGRVCEDCLGKPVPWPGVLHGCYRDSRAASAVVATTLGYHKLRGTYREQVDAYIALTEFARGKAVSAGLPPDKVFVKPNFVSPDPGVGEGRGGYALFVGRLSREKGVDMLLSAWKTLASQIPLRIVGDGPMATTVEAVAHYGGIEWLGRQPRETVLALMRDAKFLVFPSQWYEGFGMTLIEAMATGTPVVASQIGTMAEIVEHGCTGVRFEPRDEGALVEAVRGALDRPGDLGTMRRASRAEYEAKYTAAANYPQLMSIYERAIEISRAQRGGHAA